MQKNGALSPQDQEKLENYRRILKLYLKETERFNSQPAESDAHMDQWEKDLSPASRQDLEAAIRTLRAALGEMMEEDPHRAIQTLETLLGECLEPPPGWSNPKRAGSIEYPLDKVNAQIWNLLERDTQGQVALKAEKSGSKRPLNIYYSIDFDQLGQDITITKRLTPYDKRIYIAVSALFNAGNNLISLTQIYYAMGYTGRPGKTDLERINNALTKMAGAKIYVNNEQEAAAYKYAKFIYDGSLLPLERVTVIARGALNEAAIHIFREPPVITFAKQRRQITTIDVKLLQSPISKTDGNLLIDDYLIERISRAKKGQQPRRILYKTIYEKARASTAKQRQRIPEKVRRYLEHYQQCGMISRYTTEPDGVTVYFEQH